MSLSCLTRPPVKLDHPSGFLRTRLTIESDPSFVMAVSSRLSVHLGHGTAIGYGPIAHPYSTYRRGLLVNSARIQKRRSLQTSTVQLISPIHKPICYRPVRVELGLSRQIKGAGDFAYRMNVLATSNIRMHFTCPN